jgi:hypothetical protein
MKISFSTITGGQAVSLPRGFCFATQKNKGIINKPYEVFCQFNLEYRICILIRSIRLALVFMVGVTQPQRSVGGFICLHHLPSYRRAFLIGKALCSQPAPVVVAAAFCHFSALALVPIGQFFSGCLSAHYFVSGRCTTLCCLTQLFLNLFS